MSAPERENRMGTQPIPRLLLRSSVPMMLSLVTHALYNVVDSVFVSRVSEEALTALSFASPVQLLIAALGCGIAVGLNAAISKAMGEGDALKVRETASASILLALLAGVLIAVCGLTVLAPYMRWQAGGNEAIYAAGMDYLRVIMLCAGVNMLQWVFDRFLIATGRPALFLITLSAASLVNLILDPIFIFGLLGLPAMGAKGAAIATVIGQGAGALAGIVINAKFNREIPARFTLRIRWRRAGDILRVGVPTCAMQSVVALGGIWMNTLLRSFSATAVAVMGVCGRLHGLATIPVHGITNGLIPVIAYNYGAKKRPRIDESIRWALRASFLMMSVVLLLLEAFPSNILRLFDASAGMLAIGVPAIRLFAAAYFLSVYGMVSCAVFQALGRGDYSMYLSLVRQVALPLGLGWLLSRFGRVELVWAAFVLAEALCAPLCAFLMRRVRRKIIIPLDAGVSIDG